MLRLSQFIAVPALLLSLAIAGAADTPAGKPAPAATPAAAAAAAAPTASAAGLGRTDLASEEQRAKEAKKKQLEEENNWIAMIKCMGATGYFIGALALVFLVIWVERMINLRMSKISPEGLAEKAKELWKKKDFDGVRALADGSPSTLGRLISFLVNNRDRDFNIVAETAATVAQRGLARQHQANYWLTVVSTLGPLLGLFGTVVGMIDAFRAVAIAGDIGDTSMVAEGIYKSLVNTLFGLAIAMAAIGVYHYYKNKLAKFALQLEDDADHLLVAWFGASK
jgi:biopolymer transport protein ExbB